MAYGTVMIARLAAGKTVDDWQEGLEQWKAERNVDGFQSEYVLVGDDGRQLVSCVVFESEKAYRSLADDPEQDVWWREKVMPLLDGDPTWIDGTWV